VRGGTSEIRFLMCLSEYTLMDHVGRATAQTVSRRLPTGVTRVRAQVKSCGICGGQRGTAAGFLHILRFHIHLPSGAGIIGQLVADVLSGLSLTPPQEN
jgi:hypothetical protein